MDFIGLGFMFGLEVAIQYCMVLLLLSEGQFKTKRGLYWALVPVIGPIINFFKYVFHEVSLLD